MTSATPDAEREWEPIESAPRDQTPILLFNGQMILIGRWSEQRMRFKAYHYGLALEPQPMYWMPLPAPPASHTNHAAALEKQRGEGEVA